MVFILEEDLGPSKAVRYFDVVLVESEGRIFQEIQRMLRMTCKLV